MNRVIPLKKAVLVAAFVAGLFFGFGWIGGEWWATSLQESAKTNAVVPTSTATALPIKYHSAPAPFQAGAKLEVVSDVTGCYQTVGASQGVDFVSLGNFIPNYSGLASEGAWVQVRFHANSPTDKDYDFWVPANPAYYQIK